MIIVNKTKTIFLFIVFLLKYIISKNFVVIPFYKKVILTESMNYTEVIHALEKNYLLSEISLGTPPQKLLMNIKMDLAYSYVLTEKTYYELYQPEDLREFTTSSSSTFKSLENTYNDYGVFIQVQYIKDTLRAGDKIINDFHFLMPNQVAFSEDMATDSGAIGIGNIIFNEPSDLRSNFIWNLKSKNLIDSYDFFIEYEDYYHGNIIIGGEPNEYDKYKYPNRTNIFARNPSQSKYLFWGFTIDKVSYKNMDIKEIFNVVTVKIDYGFILAGHLIDEALKNDFFSEYLEDGTCFRVNSSYLHNYVCKKGKINKSKLGTLNIYSKELQKEFKIDLSQLFLDNGIYSYFLMQFRGDSSSFEFGDIFLMQYENFFVYNQDTKIMKMYNPAIKIKEEKETSESSPLLTVFLVIFIILGLIIVSLVLFLIYKKTMIRQRKKGIELLSEDLEYIPKDNK